MTNSSATKTPTTVESDTPRPRFDPSSRVTPLLVAGAEIGMGRTATYRALKEGDLPFRAIRAGGRWVVPTVELLALFGETRPAAS